MDPVALVQKKGINLGGPNRRLPAWIDFIRLNRKVDPGFVFVAIYGNESVGFSASPLGFATFLVIRRSKTITHLIYYAIEAKLIGK